MGGRAGLVEAVRYRRRLISLTDFGHLVLSNAQVFRYGLNFPLCVYFHGLISLSQSLSRPLMLSCIPSASLTTSCPKSQSRIPASAQLLCGPFGDNFVNGLASFELFPAQSSRWKI